jgi:hypothetical protein
MRSSKETGELHGTDGDKRTVGISAATPSTSPVQVRAPTSDNCAYVLSEQSHRTVHDGRTAVPQPVTIAHSASS